MPPSAKPPLGGKPPRGGRKPLAAHDLPPNAKPPLGGLAIPMDQGVWSARTTQTTGIAIYRKPPRSSLAGHGQPRFAIHPDEGGRCGRVDGKLESLPEEDASEKKLMAAAHTEAGRLPPR